MRYFASARAAAGRAEEEISAATVEEALIVVRARHSGRLAAILDVSSLLLDGQQVADPSSALPDHAELDVLPPFAGG